MVQILDIGNTHTRIAEWDGEKFCNHRVMDTGRIAEEYRPVPFSAAAACVCPAVARQLQKYQIRFINALDQDSSVDFSRADRTTLGADRVANAIALAGHFPLPGAVIDCGTAITLELVDAQKRFLGGAIAPGRRLMRHSLACGTAQLPETKLNRVIPDTPGCNTVEAINFGVGHGALGIVKELADAAKRRFQLRSLVLTGGDARYFAPALPEAVLAPDDFTLMGVLIAAGLK